MNFSSPVLSDHRHHWHEDLKSATASWYIHTNIRTDKGNWVELSRANRSDFAPA